MTERDKQSRPEGGCLGCTRREAFVKLGVSSIAVASTGAAVFGYEFLSPNVLYEPSPIVNEGKPDRYPLGSVTQDLESGVYIVHGPEGIHAMSAVCTHLGCLTVWNDALGIVACPCHGSKFNRDGTKIEGPAPRPLVWLQASLNDEGDLLVDRSVAVERKEFVKI
ncbi:MAG TPA: Rieske 2Fe-2S domain-containing protein [Bryobacteraceae bacterium]|nr:Rieske 2Fe-2S domain-containing protein [Bryobacteraceae bacterium]